VTAKPASALAVALAWLAAGALVARATGGGPAGAQPPFPARAGIAWIDVSAVDERGRPVADLAGEEFEVVADGRPQPLLAFRAPAPAGATIVLVEDLLVREALLPDVRDAVLRLAAGSRAGDVVLLASASGVSATAAPSDAALLRSTLGRLRSDAARLASLRQPAEAGRLHARRLDALVGALAALPGHAGSRALVVVGPSLPFDVEDGFGRDAHERVMRASQKAAAPIYVLGCGDDPLSERGAAGSGWADASGGVARATPLLPTTRPGAGAPRQGLYEAVAEDSGGLFSPRAAAWAEAVDQLLGRSQARYLLGFASAAPEDGRFRPVSARALRAGVRVHARRGYFAPGR
jgi:VWFA-related protein